LPQEPGYNHEKPQSRESVCWQIFNRGLPQNGTEVMTYISVSDSGENSFSSSSLSIVLSSFLLPLSFFYSFLTFFPEINNISAVHFVPEFACGS
jgi:hypothetical protein